MGSNDIGAGAGNWEREIAELHAFFQAWFTSGTGDISRADNAFAPGFTLITPDGHLHSRNESLEMVASMHRAMPGLRIWVEHMQLVEAGESHIVAMYEEWQESDANTRRGRRTSAVFTIDLKGPNGVRWLHVHETWIGE